MLQIFFTSRSSSSSFSWRFSCCLSASSSSSSSSSRAVAADEAVAVGESGGPRPPAREAPCSSPDGSPVPVPVPVPAPGAASAVLVTWTLPPPSAPGASTGRVGRMPWKKTNGLTNEKGGASLSINLGLGLDHTSLFQWWWRRGTPAQARARVPTEGGIGSAGRGRGRAGGAGGTLGGPRNCTVARRVARPAPAPAPRVGTRLADETAPPRSAWRREAAGRPGGASGAVAASCVASPATEEMRVEGRRQTQVQATLCEEILKESLCSFQKECMNRNVDGRIWQSSWKELLVWTASQVPPAGCTESRSFTLVLPIPKRNGNARAARQRQKTRQRCDECVTEATARCGPQQLPAGWSLGLVCSPHAASEAHRGCTDAPPSTVRFAQNPPLLFSRKQRGYSRPSPDDFSTDESALLRDFRVRDLRGSEDE
ncbi:Protein of unknown function [Gryllus bimaculatus]|nr:Protein of unknown function [Gryllus bimaculatus]